MRKLKVKLTTQCYAQLHISQNSDQFAPYSPIKTKNFALRKSLAPQFTKPCTFSEQVISNLHLSKLSISMKLSFPCQFPTNEYILKFSYLIMMGKTINYIKKLLFCGYLPVGSVKRQCGKFVDGYQILLCRIIGPKCVRNLLHFKNGIVSLSPQQSGILFQRKLSTTTHFKIDGV